MSIENLEMIETRLSNIEKMLIGTKEVLTFDEVVQYTGLSKSYLYKLTSTAKIPHFKPHGKIIYFDRAQVEAWLLQNPIKTTDEIQKEAVRFVTLNKGRAVK